MPSSAPRNDPFPPDRLLALHRTMQLIRATETTLSKLFADSEIPGFIHLSVGQEAVAAGVIGALAPQDTFATTHRGHGHVLARGVALDLFFKEIMGRAGGICGGRGGSMHVADLTLGVLGANGIVGAGLPLATGSALAHQTRRSGGVAVAFFGDGAMAEGALHECLNMAALWRLPMVFVCENNGWSEFSPTSRQFAATLDKLGAAFGIPHRQVDGNDLAAVAQAATEVVEAARSDGPRILECITTRWHGHFEGDPQRYRNADEIAGLPENDPLRRSAEALLAAGIEEQDLAALVASVDSDIAVALEAARADALPDFDAAFRDVYTPTTLTAGA
ncbi:thiamine pyrophosphate-dependent dehydrogenase E1 component subunit alpha [Azospirillum doebereinerae]|uniref:Thiamine pyrophosphate-dependent dehydrogenase E1 component subunit alpha n=1 Tax=Azospirillum doebereinerae TaxID=92933 RepID=A0A3S0VIT2_9PROT|nr:thiamine pyrophosphate-dependent dehydrogenase E1 component subunit alpha [Azospirillum doebereinerae]RUQ72106.1 thiamine pyrophosphate-dependent dehydrogenase E1 component subunit alpha [Azospirillum doebereinerae]